MEKSKYYRERTPELKRRYVAIHEAAHAFFVTSSGYRVRWVAIEKDNIHGQCRICGRISGMNPLPEEALIEAMLDLSGYYAELKLRDGEVNVEDVYDWLSHAEAQEELAANLTWDPDLEYLISDDTLSTLKHLRIMEASGSYGDFLSCYQIATQKTKERVEQGWEYINAIADQLVVEGHLDGGQVEEIIGGFGLLPFQ